MKFSFLLKTAAFVGASTLPVFSGGLSDSATETVVAPPPPPMVATSGNWTGGYVGGNIAFLTGTALYCDSFDGDEYDCDDPDDGLPEPNPAGAMFGLTGGYDWQRGDIVYGVAGDYLVGDLSDVADNSDDPRYGCGEGCGLEVSSIAMLRGRVGYAMDNIMPYATAGFAVTQATAFEPDNESADGTFNNIVIGAGVEYMVSPTLSAGFEVLHFLEGDDYILNDDFCGDCGATTYSATLARASVSYRF